MDTVDTEAMVSRFYERAEAVRSRSMPPVAGVERLAFIKQAEIDYMDYALIADSKISLDGGILTIDLRPDIVPQEVETQVAMENIAKALPTDGNKITPSMLDSKADLKALIDDSKRWSKESFLAAEGAG